MFQPTHCGIFFTTEAIQRAHDHREQEPYQAAWALLNGRQPASDLEAIHLNALRFRLNVDVPSGELAVTALLAPQNPGESYLDQLMDAVTLAQCCELLRDHPAFSGAAQAAWTDDFLAHVEALNQPPDDATYPETIWLGTLNTAAGIVLEHEAIFQTGIAVYREAIQNAIHPEGYILKAVSLNDGSTLIRQLMAVKGLVLMAEAAASSIGVDLWAENNRGVSVVTAAMYLIYYYFYPDKWRWDTGIGLEPTQALFQQHGGFCEMVAPHIRPDIINPLLDDLRPIYDRSGGGVTTLTHATPPKKKRGLFGNIK